MVIVQFLGLRSQSLEYSSREYDLFKHYFNKLFLLYLDVILF